ncbi:MULTISPECIES: hypothetical protein [Frankia]|uniref:hypothetical protein n=1 Tax=Frankia TaxID=1854 RepID=UPI00055A5AF2|nr:MULTISPECIES: hypothetical protein [Frankia]ORT95337.1 hypothetical protein UK99_13240 [Frankia casuarinae]
MTACEARAGVWLPAYELGTVLLEYATRTADSIRLDQAIALLRVAGAVGPETGEDYAANSHQLGRALRTRFDRHGDLADLNMAISVLQQARAGLAAARCERSTESLARILDLFCQCLRRRFEITGRLDDLDVAHEAQAASRELCRRSYSQ